jgi:AraC family transcriptional regulator
MGWVERMNQALDYIEENLTEDIDLSQVARIACHSLSSLQRIFPVIAEVPLSEYIRRRKLTMAAFELTHSDIRIVDLSVKYGYDSPEAFARAFSGLHGVTPSAARTEGVHLKAYPRISFLLTLRGDTPMDYRIETREAFAVYGIEEIFTTENQENLKKIPLFWQEAVADGRVDRLASSIPASGPDENGRCPVNALCSYRETGGATFPYMLFALSGPNSKTEGYKKAVVPASTWAIFRSDTLTKETTAQVLQTLIRRVYTEWLTNAPYEQADGFDMEIYYTQGTKEWAEYWIRVQQKK